MWNGVKIYMEIEALGLTMRTVNCLKRAGIVTVEDLQKTDAESFLKIRNMGRKSLEELQEKMKEISEILAKYEIIPFDIFRDLKEYGYDSIEDIAFLRSRELLYFLSYDIEKYRCTVRNLFKHGHMMREYKEGDYNSIDQYIEETTNIDVSEIVANEKIVQILRKYQINNIMDLKEVSLNDLKELGISEKNLSELEYELAEKHYPLKGDVIKRCRLCREMRAYVKSQEDEGKHYCADCKDRIKRMEKKKEIDIRIDLPVSTKFTSGKSGFYIMANIHNVSRKVIKVKMVDCYFVSLGRKWIPDSTLEGYTFGTEELLPDSVKSVAKIWSQGYWSYRELDNRDYMVIELLVNDNQKQIFKFLYLDKQWIEFDHHAVKIN